MANQIPLWFEHYRLQNEWLRTMQRLGRTDPALNFIEDAIAHVRQAICDADATVLPRLIPDLEWIGKPGEGCYCWPHSIGDGHQHEAPTQMVTMHGG